MEDSTTSCGNMQSYPICSVYFLFLASGEWFRRKSQPLENPSYCWHMWILLLWNSYWFSVNPLKKVLCCNWASWDGIYHLIRKSYEYFTRKEFVSNFGCLDHMRKTPTDENAIHQDTGGRGIRYLWTYSVRVSLSIGCWGFRVAGMGLCKDEQ